MQDMVDAEDRFEIIASALKSIYDQSCRSCGSFSCPRVAKLCAKCALTTSWKTLKPDRIMTLAMQQLTTNASPSTQTDKRPREAGSAAVLLCGDPFYPLMLVGPGVG